MLGAPACSGEAVGAQDPPAENLLYDQGLKRTYRQGMPLSDPDGNNLQFPNEAARPMEGWYQAEEQSGRSPGVEKPQVTSALLWSLFRLTLSRG